jgi:hypothetical protein
MLRAPFPVHAHAARALACVLLALVTSHPRRGDGKEASAEDLKVRAERYELDSETGWAEGRGNVEISYRDMAMEADQVRVNVRTKDIEATGGIYFYTLARPDLEEESSSFFWRGESIRGNLDSREFSVGKVAGQFDEWFAVAGQTEYEGSGNAVFENVRLSTCEYLLEDHAHYRIDAREVVYQHEDGRFIGKHAVYRIGNVPVFYWPYVSWNTRSGDGNLLNVRLGYRDDWGAYAKVSRRWNMGPGTQSEYTLRLMADRGVGLANDSRWISGKGVTTLHLYGMHDSDPPEDEEGMNRRFAARDDRYRAKLLHFVQPVEGLSLRVAVDWLSDIDMLEEWYESEFRDYRQPGSYADLSYQHPNFTLALQTRFRVNDFYTVSEKLPELKLTFARQPLFGSAVQYQSETGLAYLRMNWRDFDQDEWWPAAPTDLTRYYGYPGIYESIRFDTSQMVYLPFQLGSLLQFTPRAGVRLTYYDTTSARAVSDDGLHEMFAYDNPDLDLDVNNVSLYDEEGGDAIRFAGEAGFEVATRLVGTWEDVNGGPLRLDGLRHVATPYLNYTYVSDPSEDRQHLLYFDEADRLREENFVRLGVRQQLQTRRGTGKNRRAATFASIDTYADFHLDSSTGRENLGDFASKFSLAPMSDVSFSGKILVDMDEVQTRWLELGTELGDPEATLVSVSYILRDDYRRPPITTFGTTTVDYTGENITAGAISDANLLSLSVETPVGEKTSLLAQWQYDFEAGEMARQVYRIERDLHCWTGGVFAGEDYGEFFVGIVLELKAFPDVGVETEIY